MATEKPNHQASKKKGVSKAGPAEEGGNSEGDQQSLSKIILAPPTNGTHQKKLAAKISSNDRTSNG